jgi:hypothetical protein
MPRIFFTFGFIIVQFLTLLKLGEGFEKAKFVHSDDRNCQNFLLSFCNDFS